MFDVSISELTLVVIISLGVLGPKESIVCLRKIKNWTYDINTKWKNYIRYLFDENTTNDDVVEKYRDKNVKKREKKYDENYIIDKYGNVHQTYDLKALMPYLIDRNNKNINKRYVENPVKNRNKNKI